MTTAAPQVGVIPTGVPCPGFVTDLVLRCGRGDQVACSLLFELFHRQVFATVGTRAAAGRQEELAIEVFATMWRDAPSRPPGHRGGVQWVLDHAREVARAETIAEARAHAQPARSATVPLERPRLVIR